MNEGDLDEPDEDDLERAEGDRPERAGPVEGDDEEEGGEDGEDAVDGQEEEGGGEGEGGGPQGEVGRAQHAWKKRDGLIENPRAVD